MKVLKNPKLRLTFSTLVLVFAIAVLPIIAVSAQESNPDQPTDDEVNAIAKQLYCPVCENIPLDVCGTQACAQWRELIREKLAEGWTEAEIKTYFSNQYGDRVLAAPPARGLNWLVYIIPPLVFIVGAFFLYRGFSAWRQMADEPGEGSTMEVEPEVQDDYLARLEEELRNQ